MQHNTQATVSSLWIGDSLPPLAELCIQSYLDNGINFELYTYRPYGNIPQGAIMRDAREIIAEHHIYIHKTGSYAPFSDWFRYALLNQRGGFWTDMDIVCLRPDIPCETPWYAWQEKDIIACGAISFPPEHVILRLLLSLAEDPASPMPWDSEKTLRLKRIKTREIPDIAERRRQTSWAIAGPNGFTAALKFLGMDSAAAPSSAIYPVKYPDWKKCFDGTITTESPELANAWGIHLWGELIRRKGDDCPPIAPHSLIGQLLAKHNIKTAGNTDGRHQP